MSHSPKIRRAVVVATVALAVPAGTLAVAQASSTRTVKLKGEQFSPRKITIHSGDEIAFKWSGGTHNLLKGNTTLVNPRDHGTKTIKFKKTGTYTFTCTLHADMTVKVTVKAN